MTGAARTGTVRLDGVAAEEEAEEEEASTAAPETEAEESDQEPSLRAGGVVLLGRAGELRRARARVALGLRLWEAESK